jgi:hypothetical protein
MGTIRNGANGGFSGKAGSIIGSSWNAVSYIKGLPKLSNKPASPKQLDQRARFAAVLKFMGPIKDLLLKGYKGQNAGRATGFNMGIQHAINNAVIGVYPNFSIDYAMIQISKGTLQPPSSITFTSSAAGTLTISWSPQINGLNAFSDDLTMILLFNETQQFFLAYTDDGLRGDGAATLAIPADFSGQIVHGYLFYVDRNGARQSNSTYVAPITLV